MAKCNTIINKFECKLNSHLTNSPVVLTGDSPRHKAIISLAENASIKRRFSVVDITIARYGFYQDDSQQYKSE